MDLCVKDAVNATVRNLKEQANPIHLAQTAAALCVLAQSYAIAKGMGTDGEVCDAVMEVFFESLDIFRKSHGSDDAVESLKGYLKECKT